MTYCLRPYHSYKMPSSILLCLHQCSLIWQGCHGDGLKIDLYNMWYVKMDVYVDVCVGKLGMVL